MTHAVIVGTSVGGVRVAQALRREGFAGRVTLVGAESHQPYDKPPLSKHFLTGNADPGSISLLTAAEADEGGIELRLGSAAKSLETATKRIRLADGSHITFDVLVIATGAAARRSPWAADNDVHVLRSLEDAFALRTALADRGPLVVIGGGFIGAEVASTARRLGVVVEVVDPQLHPIERLVGPEIAPHFSNLHARHDTRTRFGVGVTAVEGRTGDLTVSLSTGERLHAATVVVGIGAVPNVEWLDGSQVPHDTGVACDEFGRVVGHPGMFAVGDVSAWRVGNGPHTRIEHWTNAVEQAAVVAHNIVNDPVMRAHRPDSYVWSDQYDWKVQILGNTSTARPRHVLGDLSASKAKAVILYVDNAGDLAGSVSVNWPRASVVTRRAYAERRTTADLLEELTSLPGSPSSPPSGLLSARARLRARE